MTLSFWAFLTMPRVEVARGATLVESKRPVRHHEKVFQVSLSRNALGNCFDSRDLAYSRGFPELPHPGAFRRCHGKTWNSLPPAGFSDQQEIPSGDNGFRRSFIRLPQRRPP